MTKIGYKVVRPVVIQDRISIVSTTGNTDAGIEYKVGEYVKPRKGCGPLAVFDTLNSATVFAKELFSVREEAVLIYQCEYRPSQYTELWYVNFSINKIYNTTVKDRYPMTRFASAVKLVKCQSARCIPMYRYMGINTGGL